MRLALSEASVAPPRCTGIGDSQPLTSQYYVDINVLLPGDRKEKLVNRSGLISVSGGPNEAQWPHVDRIHNIPFHSRTRFGVADASAGREIAVSKHGSP
jgi:hypothetical protein